MEFNIQPRPMIGTRLFVDIVGNEKEKIKLYWELKTLSGKIIDSGNYFLPKNGYMLFAGLQINNGGHIEGDEMRQAINQLLASPDIDMVLADYVADPPPPPAPPPPPEPGEQTWFPDTTNPEEETPSPDEDLSA